MSFNVMVIPEDLPNDRWMLEPIIRKMIREITGIRNPKVRVCPQRFSGVADVLNWPRLQEVLDRYQWGVDLFLLCVDRDGNADRKQALENLERQASAHLNAGKALLGENAWQEIEVWVLAGHTLPRTWHWPQVRAEVNPKEVYFEPFAARRGLADAPGGGRKQLAEEAVQHYERIRRRCPQDIGSLEERIRRWIGT